ncbi:MAG: Npt1/Npt2 family nucleotide transporter [Parachlamydiaceae bacterium]
MKNSDQNNFIANSTTPLVKRALILGQFFLIIFVYHILKDLKDTLVITSSDAGAQVIPFLKIWVILPFAILTSYLFSKIYQRFGREKTLYFFVSLLLVSYALFAFCLYPFREKLHFYALSDFLTLALPVGFKGFISMVSYWIYTLFYLTAELWAMMILTVLFWGYLNEIHTSQQAKSFYPICVFVGNCAGILSGQTSRFLCHSLMDTLSWQETLQIMVSLVIVCGIGIMVINRLLSNLNTPVVLREAKKNASSMGFTESVLCIVQSKPLMCIATLVVGFALTSNLIEVVWKETIKGVYPSPQAYNAYVNQLTSIIGTFAVCTSLLSRWIFQRVSWVKIALVTPVSLFITSFAFFFSMQIAEESLSPFASLFKMNSLYFVMTMGSIYYVLALTAKYTIFDMCKEMAFLSIHPNERMRAKSVIDSIGSRLGKSGSSCLYQVLLITFGSTAGHVSIVGITAILVIGISIIATKKLGDHISSQGADRLKEEQILVEAPG